ncbi:MAG: penicillin acylase family protein [Sediminibacterium sp.]|jgi:penicillin G amidase|nr:penicillin acylase family protein [Sediminibacterium sp.]
MRLLPLIASAIVTTALVFTLNIQLKIGNAKAPRLGYFLSPQHGFWKNAEKIDANFDASIVANELLGNVDVYVDDRLVPHIYADHDQDAYFVQGYLHAKFRLWQMDFETRVASGRLSEIAGADKLPIDRMFRRLGMVYGAEKTEANINETNPNMKATVDAYTAGVNAYIKQLDPADLPFEFKLMNYAPEDWTPKKTYLFLMFMSYDLTGRSSSVDLQRTNTRDYLGYDLFDKLYTNHQDSLDPIIPKGTVYEKPSIVPVKPLNADSAYLHKVNSVAFNTVDMPEAPDKNNGSNNWAVAGSKTKSGRPILSSDPHLGLNLPSLWYEMQITTPTHSTYGASFPGSPAVIIGFNDSLAWGVTNAGRDVFDYYEIKFKDTTENEYWFNGAWKATTKRKEVIKVKDSLDVVEEIAMTHWGPTMFDAHYQNTQSNGRNLAVQWTALTASTGVETFYLLNRAKNYDDYLHAISLWTCPGQNFVLATKSGDIAIKQQGSFVARWERQGDFIMPGEDTSFQWQGIIPTNENPMIKNPERGFVSSANQKSTDASYPYYLGAASAFPLYRGISVNMHLNKMFQITAEDMQKLQTDNYNVFAATARPALMKYIQLDNLSSDAKRMVTEMTNWDLYNSLNAKGITCFKIIWDSLEQAVWGDELAGSAIPLLKPEAYVLLDQMLKDTNWSIADDIRTKDKVEDLKTQVTLGVEKATEKLLALEKENKLEWALFKATRVLHLTKTPALSRMDLPIGGGVNIINATKENHGPSWRMVVHLTDEIEAYGLYPGGQSGNPGSPYYDTFVNYWAEGKYYRLLFLSKEKLKQSERKKWHMQFQKTNS